MTRSLGNKIIDDNMSAPICVMMKPNQILVVHDDANV